MTTVVVSGALSRLVVVRLLAACPIEIKHEARKHLSPTC
jgi:hypothetical protein